MARKSGHNKPYTRKGGGRNFRYKWGPFDELPKDLKEREARRKKKEEEVTCTATPGSQGYDNDVTYVYIGAVTENGIENKAYVECDYVE